MTGFLQQIQEIDPRTIDLANQIKPGEFCNPRHFCVGGKGKGLEQESMSQLKSDVTERGLRNPIDCRRIVVDGEERLQLVAGERRLTVALQLGLESVPVRIHEGMSDEEAWKFAWRDDDIPKNIGENATASLVKHWREQGFDDAKIIDITGRTKAWLRQMDILGQLDPESFTAYSDGHIGLRNALKLAQIPDLELRIEILRSAIQEAEADHDRRLAQARASLRRAEDRLEVAQANVALARSMGDEEEEAQRELAEAEKAVSSAEDRYREQRKQTPKAKARNLAAGAKKVGKQLEGNLSKVKMKRLSKVLDQWIENDGLDDDERFVAEIAHLRLVKAVLECISGGNDDLRSVFAGYYAQMPEEEPVDDDDEDFDEIPEDDSDDEDDDDDNDDNDDGEAEDDMYDDLEREDYDEVSRFGRQERSDNE